MTLPDPQSFAEEWIAAWNAHDLEPILKHYADNIVFLSPKAAALTGCGEVRGKEALRAYWAKALAKTPDLHFVLESVYAGFDSLTIAYQGVGGRRAAETLKFGGDGRVVAGTACYKL